MKPNERGDSEPVHSPPRARFWWRGIAFGVAVAAFLWALRHFGLIAQVPAALEWIRAQGAWGPIIFIALYIVATVLFIPGSVLTLGAGAVFGVARGSMYASIAATLGATAAFLVGRYVARDAVALRIQGNERFAALDHAIASEGWKIVGLTRLSPVFPFTVLNYALSLTNVKLGHYVLASWIGMMPGTVMYVYLGSLAKSASGERARTTGEWALYAVGLLATIVVTVLVTRIARRALARKITPPPRPGKA